MVEEVEVVVFGHRSVEEVQVVVVAYGSMAAVCWWSDQWRGLPCPTALRTAWLLGIIHDRSFK